MMKNNAVALTGAAIVGQQAPPKHDNQTILPKRRKMVNDNLADGETAQPLHPTRSCSMSYKQTTTRASDRKESCSEINKNNC